MKKILFLLIYTIAVNASYSQEKIDIPSKSVKILDADFLGKFKQGFAIISKGNSSSLINRKGEQIIPYGKYLFLKNNTNRYEEGFVNGMCRVQDIENSRYGFVDTAGRTIIPCQYLSAGAFDEEGFATVQDLTNQYYFINKENKKTLISKVFIYTDYNQKIKTRPLVSANGGLENLFKAPIAKPVYENAIHASFSDGLCPGFDKQFGYYNRQGKKIIDNQFEFAEPFSEGLAAVAKKNDFGELKWGFIDLTGRTIIDFKYSIQPSNFHSNYAVVTPSEKSEFLYAYIDKGGNIVHTVKDKTENESVEFQNKVAWVGNNGNLNLLTTEFKSYSLLINSNKSDKKGKPITIGSFGFNTDISNDLIKVNVDHKYGFVDLNGIVVTPIKFESLDFPDPTSGLSSATYLTTNNDKVEGYVNLKGEFLIVKGEKSKW